MQPKKLNKTPSALPKDEDTRGDNEPFIDDNNYYGLFDSFDKWAYIRVYIKLD